MPYFIVVEAANGPFFARVHRGRSSISKTKQAQLLPAGKAIGAVIKIRATAKTDERLEFKAESNGPLSGLSSDPYLDLNALKVAIASFTGTSCELFP